MWTGNRRTGPTAEEIDLARKLCKWKKGDIEKKLKKYSGLVSEPQFVCKSCGRVANDKKSLCKPMALES
jgi:hypothetical protein